LIISDIWLPDAVGLLIAERLKILGCGETPVIFITASKKQNLWKIAQEVGAVAFFEKPYDSDKLLKAIASALEQPPTFQLPSDSAPSQLDWTPPVQPTTEGNVKKVLIVEDDPNIAASLDIRFTANGYVTLLANDALQGTRLAVQTRPNLVVLDISMPAGNGLTVAANLKNCPKPATSQSSLSPPAKIRSFAR